MGISHSTWYIGDLHVEAMSRVAAQEVGFDNLCEIVDGRLRGIDSLIHHLRRIIFPMMEHESKE